MIDLDAVLTVMDCIVNGGLCATNDGFHTNNDENLTVDDRQAHLQKWLVQLVIAKQLIPDAEGDDGQKMLYDFLCGDNEPEFHRMMTEGVPEEGSMKQATGSKYD